MDEIVGYCMKCKAKRKMTDGQNVKMGKKKDRDAHRGKCEKCGTSMYKILSAADKKKLGL